MRADLLYGYGWTNARLADAASPELRQVNLTRAQAALRQAVKLMPFGRKRQDAQMDLARVLIHDPQRLVGVLPGAERLSPAEHHD